MSSFMSWTRGTRGHDGAGIRRPRSRSTPSTLGENQPKLTRTGRHSKALKGLSVHYCDLCAKVCLSRAN